MKASCKVYENNGTFEIPFSVHFDPLKCVNENKIIVASVKMKKRSNSQRLSREQIVKTLSLCDYSCLLKKKKSWWHVTLTEWCIINQFTSISHWSKFTCIKMTIYNFCFLGSTFANNNTFTNFFACYFWYPANKLSERFVLPWLKWVIVNTFSHYSISPASLHNQSIH